MSARIWKLGALLGVMAVFSARGQESRPQIPFLLGADVSMAPKLEEQGVVYKDGGKPKDIFAIFRDHGATCIRLRIFVNPNGRGGVVNDTAYTIALAKRVKAAGLLFSLDFHYSDTWADPAHQQTPAAWKDLSFPQLVEKTRDYTAETLKAFRDAGVTPDIIQIGNEITHGLLWPMGALGSKNVPEDVAFDHVAELLKADVQGIHLALGDDTRTKIMIHIDGGDATGTAKWFFDGITSRHVPFDMIGLSYYPFWGGGLPSVKKTFEMLAKTYGKPIIIAETAYPFEESTVWKGQRKSLAWPLTLEGQKQYLADLLKLVRETPNGLGAGLLYWYPESVPPKDSLERMWNNGEAAMFDHDGNALPAFDAYGNASAPVEHIATKN
jgi:arabinogalactan endo-1,4-beta-galactosidase